MSLYNINKQIQACLDRAVNPESGEFIADVEQLSELQALEISRSEMLLELACEIKNKQALAKAHRAEANAQTQKAIVLENQAKWLREYIVKELYDKEKIEDTRVSLLKKKSPPALKILVPVEDLDPDYLKHYTESDDKAIKAALLAGNEIKGCQLVQGWNVTIK
jgi:hypothetical protein